MIKSVNRLDILDLTKFILSFFVVGIHTLGKYAFSPVSRCAVPLFFIISSYLFWSRLDGLNDKKIILKFILRNAKLYLFWFIVFLPYILVKGRYQQGNILINFIKLLGKILLGSTFTASWYIAALTIGVLIVYFSTKIFNQNIVLIVCLLIYILCCLCSNYYLLFDNSDSIIQMIYTFYPGTIYNSFPVGLFWISLGSVLAKKTNQHSFRFNLILSIVSLVFLYIEYYIIKSVNCSQDNDCYIALIPLCGFLFELLIDIRINIPKSKTLCEMSTIIYCSHGMWVLIIMSMLSTETIWGRFCLFVLTIAASMILALIILSLKKYRFFRFLKYSH